jgi:hypothetical protein
MQGRGSDKAQASSFEDLLKKSLSLQRDTDAAKEDAEARHSSRMRCYVFLLMALLLLCALGGFGYYVSRDCVGGGLLDSQHLCGWTSPRLDFTSWPEMFRAQQNTAKVDDPPPTTAGRAETPLDTNEGVERGFPNKKHPAATPVPTPRGPAPQRGPHRYVFNGQRCKSLAHNITDVLKDEHVKTRAGSLADVLRLKEELSEAIAATAFNINAIAAVIAHSKVDTVAAIADSNFNTLSVLTAAIAHSKVDTVAAIADSNFNTLSVLTAAIADSNVDTVAAITDGNVNTLAAIADSNVNTLAVIADSNVNTLAAINAIAAMIVAASGSDRCNTQPPYFNSTDTDETHDKVWSWFGFFQYSLPIILQHGFTFTMTRRYLNDYNAHEPFLLAAGGAFVMVGFDISECALQSVDVVWSWVRYAFA